MLPNILTIRNKIRASVLVGITYSFSVVASDAADPYLWLEEVEGVKALNWVQEQNAQSLKKLKADVRYPQLYQNALKNLNSSDRLPDIQLIGNYAYDLLKNEQYKRGLWRRSTLESFQI